jgi:tetratricopeptide (TPR) repeat protein
MEQVQRLRRYVEENPEDSSALRVLANMNQDIQNWLRAAELYERLLVLEPGDHDVMTDLGICYRNLERPSDALEQFRLVHAADPKNWHSRYNEVLVLAIDLKDFAAAKVVLEELEILQPDNLEVRQLAAEVHRLSGA